MNLLIYEVERMTEVFKYSNINLSSLDFIIAVGENSFKYTKDRRGSKLDYTYNLSALNDHLKSIEVYYLKDKLIKDLMKLTGDDDPETSYRKLSAMIADYERLKNA